MFYLPGSNAFAGYVMMTGQVFDAISTPLVGYESDVSKGCFKYGRRKSWHLMGETNPHNCYVITLGHHHNFCMLKIIRRVCHQCRLYN